MIPFRIRITAAMLIAALVPLAAFGVLLVIGIVVLFSGFLVSGTARTTSGSVPQKATPVSLSEGQNAEESFYRELIEISRDELSSVEPTPL